MRRIASEILIAGCLALVTLVVYWPACDNRFVNFDDNVYVTENSQLRLGLTWSGFAWAFSTFHAANWHPVTWISFLVDYQLAGLNPTGYHATNVVLHALNAILVFFALRALTRTVWPSAFIAALFALHPLHVESVAWVSERKDVLSTLFWMLALLAYAWYAAAPSLARYLPVVCVFALGLMAKPMLVTLPFVLLLLDFWPLRRTPLPFWEKTPLFLMAAASCVVTCYAQAEWNSFQSLHDLSLRTRLANALVSYARYIEQMLCPVSLCAYYPYSAASLSTGRVVLAAALLFGVTIIAIREARRRPYLLVGWFWYLGTLVPVIGVVQVGVQALADRYTYVPLIGLFLMLAFSLAEGASSLRRPASLVAVPLAILIACGVRSFSQIGYWHDSVTLWTHVLEVAPDNSLAQYNLGIEFEKRRNPELAAEHYAAALAIDPKHPGAHTNLGVILADLGYLDEAIRQYRAALKTAPDYAEAHNNLGTALAREQKYDEAIEHLQAAVAIRPDYANAYQNLGFAYLHRESWTDAVAALSRSVGLQPDNVQSHCWLGLALGESGEVEASSAQYQVASRLDANWVNSASRTAWLVATDPDPRRRNGRTALLFAKAACQANGYQDRKCLDALAAAYAECGDFDRAASAARKALGDSSTSWSNRASDAIQARLRLYERGQPFRDSARAASP
jgi:tetratricopeptide (TPR) repeat protein